MAPEIALSECAKVPEGALVVDPMAGSGTTLHAAVEHGCTAIGVDVDPLAVLLSRVRISNLDIDHFDSVSSSIAESKSTCKDSYRVRSIDDDPPTRTYVNYWFASDQQRGLRQILSAIDAEEDWAVRNALLVCFSRLIITKDRGASLGRDVSHSRPHKVMEENDFDVFAKFRIAARKVSKYLRSRSVRGVGVVSLGDARSLLLPDAVADLAITSPPYLNAIDYLRGHRLSLVWLGYTVAQIRAMRSTSMGAERRASPFVEESVPALRDAIGGYKELASRYQGMVDRYLLDLLSVFSELHRVVRHGGRVTSEVGNSMLRGSFLRNDEAARCAAEVYGLMLVDRTERALPENRRYLPIMTQVVDSQLGKRMRTETVLSFVKA